MAVGGCAAPGDRVHAVSAVEATANSTSGGCGLSRRGGSGGVGVALWSGRLAGDVVERKTCGRHSGAGGGAQMRLLEFFL